MTHPRGRSAVTVVLPVRDDRPFIRDCLDSIRRQHVPVARILVVDEGSKDGTIGIASRVSGAVAAPSGWRGELAPGAVVWFADPRARYPADHLGICLDRLGEGHGAVATSLVPVGTTSFGRAVAALGRMAPAPAGLGCQQVRPPGSALTPIEAPGAVPWLVAGTAGDLLADLRRYRPRSGARRWAEAAAAVVLAASAAGAIGGRGPRRWAVPAAHAVVCAGAALWVGRRPGVAPHRAFLAAEIAQWVGGALSVLGAARGGRRAAA